MSDEASRRNDRSVPLSRRRFAESVAGASLAAWGISSTAGCAGKVGRGADVAAIPQANEVNRTNSEVLMSDEIVKAKIRRALLSGPESITRDATVAEIGPQGKMTVLRQGTNQWVCIPGNENIIG